HPVMRRLTFTTAAMLSLCGCGYIGEPMPPALNIPQPVQDLRVVQYGDRLVVDFTIPGLTMEQLPVKETGTAELRIGPGGAPFDMNRWIAGAKEIPITSQKPGSV